MDDEKAARPRSQCSGPPLTEPTGEVSGGWSDERWEVWFLRIAMTVYALSAQHLTPSGWTLRTVLAPDAFEDADCRL